MALLAMLVDSHPSSLLGKISPPVTLMMDAAETNEPGNVRADKTNPANNLLRDMLFPPKTKCL